MKNKVTPLFLLYILFSLVKNDTFALSTIESYLLLSKKNCTRISEGMMGNCSITEEQLNFLENIIEKEKLLEVVPYRSDIELSDNCYYNKDELPLEIDLYDSNGLLKNSYDLDYPSKFFQSIRSKTNSSLKKISLRVKSKYLLSQLMFPKDCEITLSVKMNVVDVLSRIEAINVLKKYDDQIKEHENNIELLKSLKRGNNHIQSLFDFLNDQRNLLNRDRVTSEDLYNINLEQLEEIASSNVLDQDKKIVLLKIITLLDEVKNNHFLNLSEELKIILNDNDLKSIDEIRSLLLESDNKIAVIKTVIEELKVKKVQAEHYLKEFLEKDTDDFQKITEELRVNLNEKFNGKFGYRTEFSKMMGLSL